MRDDGTRCRDEIEVGVVDPDRVDDVHPITQQAEVGRVLHEASAGEARLLVLQHALQLGFEHVGVEGQAMGAAQRIEVGEIFGADALRRRHRHRRPQPPVGMSVPAADQVVVGGQQFGVAEGRWPSQFRSARKGSLSRSGSSG